MGISGLLPLLKKASTNCNVRRFSGCTVAIDAYCWLHKGAFGCAAQLGKGEPTTAYVSYCIKYINVLLSHNIKPILVLDGRNLPSKSETEKKRREKREENRKNAKEFLRKGMKKEAWECFTRCVDITPAMAREFIKVLRQMKIDYIVAPYEADSQLAYLARNNIVDLVITEDSDLILFGCPKIFFKMNVTGDGTLFDSAKIPKALGVKPTQYDFDRFRWMCILSGCDYLASIPGIGLGRAKKLIEGTTSKDIRTILKAIPSLLRIEVEVPESYIEGFIQAERTFNFQLIFDTMERKLKPLTPYTTDVDQKALGFAGTYVDKKLALQMALGNVDLHSLKQVDYFDIDKPSSGYAQTSIWSPRFTVPTTARIVTARDLKKQTTHTPTIGMQATVSVSVSSIKRQSGTRTRKNGEIDSDSLKENSLADSELLAMYGGGGSSKNKAEETETEIPTKKVLKRRRSSRSRYSSQSESEEEASTEIEESSEPEDVKPLKPKATFKDEVSSPSPAKRRNPFLKIAKTEISNSSECLKYLKTESTNSEKIEMNDSSQICRIEIERNKVYRERRERVIVKSQYFRESPSSNSSSNATTNTKLNSVKANFDIKLDLSDEEDCIKIDPEVENGDSQLSIYSIATAGDEEGGDGNGPLTGEDEDKDSQETRVSKKSMASLSSQSSSASASASIADSTVGFPGSESDTEIDSAPGSPSLLKSPVLPSRFRRHNENRAVVLSVEDDSDEEKPFTSPGYSGKSGVRSRLRNADSPSASSSRLSKFRRSRSPTAPMSFQSNRRVVSPRKSSSTSTRVIGPGPRRVGLSKKELAKKDPKQKTISSMFALQQKAKI